MSRKTVSVLLSEGYLTLTSKEAIELFDDYVNNGMLFELLSNLFNEYAKGQDNNNALAKELMAIKQSQKVILERLELGTQLSLPNGESNIVEPSIEVKEVIVKKAPTKPPKTGGGGLLSQFGKNFNKFK